MDDSWQPSPWKLWPVDQWCDRGRMSRTALCTPTMLEAYMFSSNRNGFSLHVSCFAGLRCLFSADLDAIQATFTLLHGASK